VTPATIFNIQMALGYVAWLLCFAAYGWPRLRAMEPADAIRAIAVLHAFRFFGLGFAFPGLVEPGVPSAFAQPAAMGDLAASLLAIFALLAFRSRPLFWLFAMAFNVVGASDLILNYVHAVHLSLPEMSGRLGVMYAVPVIYVPILMITHVVAFALMVRGLLGQRVDHQVAVSSPV
jgi:hypothetical protein